MKRIQKLFTLALACTLLLGGFSGCTKNNHNSNNPNGTGSNEKATEIVWWQFGNEPKDLADVEAKINEYLKEKINVKLKLKFGGSADFTEKMSKIINTGENYDITFTCSWANQFLPNAHNGAFLGLNDLVESEGKGLLEVIPEALWDGVRVNGEIYGVPTYKDSAFAPYFVFNKNDISALGLNAEDYNSMEKLEGALKAYKDAYPDKYPFYMTASEGYHGFFDEFDMLINNDYPIGVRLDDETLTVVNPFETEIIQKKWDLLNSWFQKGYINQDATTLQESPKVKFLFGGHGYPYADVTEWSKDYPAVGVPRFEPYYTTGSIQGSINAISINSKHPEEAMRVLNLLNTDSTFRNLMAYGLEDVNYKKTGDNSIEKLNKNWDVSVFAQGTFFNMFTVDPAPKDMWEAVRKQNEGAKPAATLGFGLDTSNIDTELALVKAAYAKYKPLVTTGAKSRAETYDAMMKELENAGIGKIIKEAQEQINKWNEGKEGTNE